MNTTYWSFFIFDFKQPTTQQTQTKVMNAEQKNGVKVLLKIITVIVGIILSIGFLIHLLQTSDGYRRKNLIQVQKEYGREHSGSGQWFIQNIPSPEVIVNTRENIWTRGEVIRQNLASCKSVSKETEKIWSVFHDFGTTVQLNLGMFPEKDLLRTVGTLTDENSKGLKEHREISFLPEELAGQHIEYGRSQLFLSWRSDMGISIAALEWPEKFLAGILYHELYHGSLHPVDYANPDKGYFSSDTYEYALEEIRAHTIESSVLNFKSNGLYYKKFDEIIGRGIIRKDTEDILVFVTVKDLKEFDKIFGLESGGAFMASFAYSQYLYGLAIYYMDKQGKGEVDKVALYRKLVRLGVMN